MGLKKIAVLSGNWSEGSNWLDGVAPTSIDDVYLNGMNMLADNDISYGNLYSTAYSEFGSESLPNMCVPLMVSNTSPEGVASDSSGNATAYLAFDRKDNTQNGARTAGAWCKYQFATSKIITRYGLKYSQSANRWTGWTFEGSNDNVVWTTIHTVTGLANMSFYDSGVIANSTAYLYYRVVATSVAGAGYLYGFEMTEDSTHTCTINNTGGTIAVSDSRTITQLGSMNISTVNGIILVTATSGSTVTFAGNPYAGETTHDQHGIVKTGNCQLIIIGNPTGSKTYENYAVYIKSNGGSTNVTGNPTGGSGTSGNITAGIYISGSDTLSITGVLTGGSGKLGSALFCAGSGAVDITGLIIANVGRGIDGTINNTNNITVNGDVYASNFNNGIYSPTLVKLYGNAYNTSNYNSLFVNMLQLSHTADTLWKIQDDNGATINLSTNTTDIHLPDESNVRKNTNYGIVGQFTGTLAVPPPESVALNVPTDDTTGTMQITPPDIQAACESALTAYGAAKTSDLSSIDIQTGLTAYGAAKTSDLAGIDIGAGLTAYGAAKTTDIINELKTSPEDVAERIRNLATVEAVGDIHAT